MRKYRYRKRYWKNKSETNEKEINTGEPTPAMRKERDR